MTYKSLILFITIFIKCDFNQESNIYLKYIEPKIKSLNIVSRNFKVIALANDACRDCGNKLLKNLYCFDCSTILIYDAIAYSKPSANLGCAKYLEDNNDEIARIFIPNVNGHRIYWINDNRIYKVNEINSQNIDSLIVLLQKDSKF